MDTLVFLTIALIGSNIITLIFLLFDRQIFTRQKTNQIADELYGRAVQRFEQKLDSITDRLLEETQHQLDLNSTHYLDITERLKKQVYAAYESDVQKYQQATQEIIQKISGITEVVHNELKSNSQQLYEQEKFSIKEYVDEEKKRAGAFMSQLVTEKVQLLVSHVLHATLNTQDHERAVREALKYYHLDEESEI
jgi:hypothetical protein